MSVRIVRKKFHQHKQHLETIHVYFKLPYTICPQINNMTDANDDDGLLNIDVDADDYAEAAAGDTPSVPRTYQSEADFQQQQASYTAKVDNGDNHLRLYEVVPVLRPDDVAENAAQTDLDTQQKSKLSKKEFQLVGYAMAELYYDRKYTEALQLCQRLQARCLLDTRMAESVSRWAEKCRGKLAAPV